jgi:hypothetical protein
MYGKSTTHYENTKENGFEKTSEKNEIDERDFMIRFKTRYII